MFQKRELTSEELILEAASRHIFIYQKPMLFFTTVSYQFHQIWMSQLPKKNHFSLLQTKL